MNGEVELWREPQVLQKTGLRRSTMRNYVASGNFPAPIKLGIRCSAWPSNLVQAWIVSRIEQAAHKAA